MKYTLFDEIGEHFLDKAIELVKAGHRFVYVIDNIDWEVKVHDMRQNNQNKSMHAIATSIVFDRVSSYHLPNSGIGKSFRVIVAKLLIGLFRSFHSFKDVMPEQQSVTYSNEMMEQSGLHNTADRARDHWSQKIFEVGRKKWRVKLKSLKKTKVKRKKERKNRKDENEKK
jgi:hypothetical protein